LPGFFRGRCGGDFDVVEEELAGFVARFHPPVEHDLLDILALRLLGKGAELVGQRLPAVGQLGRGGHQLFLVGVGVEELDRLGGGLKHDLHDQLRSAFRLGGAGVEGHGVDFTGSQVHALNDIDPLPFGGFDGEALLTVGGVGAVDPRHGGAIDPISARPLFERAVGERHVGRRRGHCRGGSQQRELNFLPICHHILPFRFCVDLELGHPDRVEEEPLFELRVDIVHVAFAESPGAAVDETEVAVAAVAERSKPFASVIPAQHRAGLAEGDRGRVDRTDAVADQPGAGGRIFTRLEYVVVEAAGGSAVVTFDVAVQAVGVFGVGVVFPRPFDLLVRAEEHIACAHVLPVHHDIRPVVVQSELGGGHDAFVVVGIHEAPGGHLLDVAQAA